MNDPRTSEISEIQQLIEELPPDLQQEVKDFVEFLFEKHLKRPKKDLQLKWRGALRDMRAQYSSVQLQHKISEWWGD